VSSTAFRVGSIAVALALSVATASAQDIGYNAMPGTDFSKYKTYKWVQIKDAQYPDQIMDSQIKTVIDGQLATKGLTKTEDDSADLYVGYQVAIDKAKAGSIDVRALNELLGTLCNRHAIRLSKWHLVDSLELLGDVANFTEAGGARTHDEFRELCEHLMLAADRLQAWVDRIIPWHTLDDRLELVP